MRTIVIGDIHGCARTFSRLLEQVRPDTDRDRLILLGDLMDRGPDTWQVWQDCVELERAMGDRFVLLLGNHEDYWLRERLSLSEWLLHRRVGRQATADSFKLHGEDIRDMTGWLRERAVLYWRDEELQCAHAGVLTEPIESNDRQTLLHDHEAALRNEYAGRLTVTGHIAHETVTWYPGGGQAVETWPEGTEAALPSQGILCIDTGCGKGGALTALCVEEGQARVYAQPELDVF